jgi:spore germination cell wall hydrolase CwlJ-like protein
LTRFLGARGAAAVGALLLSMVGGSTGAYGQVQASALIAQSFDLRTMPAPMIQALSQGSTPVTATAIAPAVGSTLPLASLVDANSVGDLDEEANCLATAVFFESKGEPLEGQLAVAQVVMNRAASGRYPATLCGVVKQHAQFSFVRNGAFPSLDPNCESWRKARAIARIAQKHLVATVPTDVLWYHANYVAPRWRQALVKVEQIGAHIFYRA